MLEKKGSSYHTILAGGENWERKFICSLLGSLSFFCSRRAMLRRASQFCVVLTRYFQCTLTERLLKKSRERRMVGRWPPPLFYGSPLSQGDGGGTEKGENKRSREGGGGETTTMTD